MRWTNSTIGRMQGGIEGGIRRRDNGRLARKEAVVRQQRKRGNLE